MANQQIDPLDRLVIVSDHQARYADWATHAAVCMFLKDFQPHTLVVNGDLLDLEAISTFRSSLTKRQSILEDIHAGSDILRHYRITCPKARIVLIEGNHEARLSHYILDHAAELEGLPGLTIPDLLDVKALNIEYVGPYGRGIDWHGIYIYHGARLSAHAAASAHAEYVDAGTSGASGHTQRLGAYYVTDRVGPHAWFESGCLCRIDPDGAPPSARGPRVNNWQQGFVVGYYHAGAELWNLYPVHIWNHQFVWADKLYGGHNGP